jgi:hypothetical protein
MPTIAQYDTTPVSTQVTPQPLAQDAPAAAFGAPIAKGISDVAQSAVDFKQRIDTTAAEESLVQFERDKNDLFFNPDTGYFNTLGRDAYDNSPAAAQALEDLKKQYGETLNQQSKLLFDKSADAHITRSQVDISRHAAKGLKTWEVSTIEAQAENSVENASLYWNQPDRLKVQNLVGRQAVIDSANMMGLSSEATNEKLQTFDSSFAKASIEAATQSSAAEGKTALEEFGDRLEGPDKVKMEGHIERKTKVEKTEADARAAVLTSTKLVDQYDNRNDIIEEVNKIEDADLRKKTMTESMAQFGRKKQAESEARATTFEDGEKHIMEGGTAESFKMQNPEGWELLSPKQQRSIESGGVSVTDWNAFSDLMLLPKSKLAKVDPTEHFNKLAKTERSKLISAVKAAGGKGSAKDKIDQQVGRTRSAQTTAALEQLFGKKSKWNDDKREKINGFYSLLDDEVRFRETQKDAKLTSEEYTDLLSGLTRTVVQEKDFWFDAELDITDVPSDDVPVLSKFLRDNNVPVTSDNLIKAYKQASK